MSEAGSGRGLPIILVGTSGSGKSTLCAMLEKRGIGMHSVSLTTRDMRPGEKDGKDYFFVSEDEFNSRLSSGELLEHAVVHGRLYGTSACWLEETLTGGHVVLMDIDIQGAIQVQERYPEAKVIFILPPSFSTLEERLRQRDRESESEIQRRLRNGLEELRMSDRFDYLLVNDDIERSCVAIEDIVNDCKGGMASKGNSSALLTDNCRELARKWIDFAENEIKSLHG